MNANHWHFSIRARQNLFNLSAELVGRGKITVLIGPNGSGKTTILRAMAGMADDAEIEFILQRRTIESRKIGICIDIHEREIGYMPQGYALFPSLTVEENVMFGLRARCRQLCFEDRAKRVSRLLESVECRHHAKRYINGLSGGEMQRVALARALSTEPKLLLLDEPMSAMDVGGRTTIRAALKKRIDEAGCPALIVTHDIRDATALADYVYVLENGVITQHGSLKELAAQPRTEFVSEFCHPTQFM